MKHGHIIAAFRAVLSIAVLNLEYGIFFSTVMKCHWPTLPARSAHLPAAHVLLITDPQILDRHSYPERSSVLTYLSQVFTDLNMRKSWRAILRKQPGVIFVLGDMMDNGRLAFENDEYEQYYRRYQAIFNSNSIPQFFLPGNHDVGYASPKFSHHVHSRFITHFGPLNSNVQVAGHTFLLIDAPGLAEEDNERTAASLPLTNWHPKPNGTLEFVMNFSRENNSTSIILLTHIPLARSQNADCGPQRERGTIRAGFGMDYQNTLGPDISSFLLDILHPAITVAYSGDDHDYCEYTHPALRNNELDSGTREVTVKSLSMAMGVRRPGFQLLSLAQDAPPSLRSSDKYADTLCHLPDQLGIYLIGYPCVVILSLLAIGWINSPWFRSYTSRSDRKSVLTRWLPMSTSQPHVDHIGRRSSTTSTTSSDEYEDSNSLPRPVAADRRSNDSPRTRNQRSCLGTVFQLIYRPTVWILLSGTSRHPRPRRFWHRFLRDFRDVAIFPIGMFVAVALWVSI
ncbi:hypothetical protein BDN72DRAFT_760618 [Pluteus cervinus]|uniref:Uncharacterized protein n=1 Tax=Pluteus cervinus TaxID=181527 RepID=A0ACD3B8C5_9AGAR|nr:hypothetical protein BDN72DRAFT_760618 [Pluteus cervinus]